MAGPNGSRDWALTRSWGVALAAFKTRAEWISTRVPPGHPHKRSLMPGGRSMGKPAVVWFEVTGKDGNALQGFYRDLFGWKIDDAGDGSGYGLVQAEDKGIAGGIGRSSDGGAGAVTFYVEVDDPQAYLAKAEALGGRTVIPPTELPQFGLTFAFFTDPEGHLVGLSKGAVQEPMAEALPPGVVIPQVDFETERLTVVVLFDGPRRAEYSGEAAQRLANDHVQYVIGLANQGHLLAAGALIDDAGQRLTGLGFSRLAPEQLRPLVAKDPAVVAGMDAFKIVTYALPKGAIDFPQRDQSPTHPSQT
jgi:uncharacterized protein